MPEIEPYSLLFPGLGSQLRLRSPSPPRSDIAQSAASLITASLGWDPFLYALGSAPRGWQRDAAAMAQLFVDCIEGWAALPAGLAPPVAIAAYSAGLFPALVASEAASLEEGVALMVASLRGVKMLAPGGDLLGVVGLGKGGVEGFLNEGVYLSHDNGPGHLIVGGQDEALDLLAPQLEGAGAFSLRRMHLASPYHTPWLGGAGELAMAYLPEAMALGRLTPRVPLLTGVGDEGEWKAGSLGVPRVLAQLEGAIYWPGVTASLSELGVSQLLAVGPGEGLLRWTARMMPGARRMGI